MSNITTHRIAHTLAPVSLNAPKTQNAPKPQYTPPRDDEVFVLAKDKPNEVHQYGLQFFTRQDIINDLLSQHIQIVQNSKQQLVYTYLKKFCIIDEKINISPDFFMESIVQSDYLIIKMRNRHSATRSNKGRVFRGFCCVSVKPKYLYVDLVCSDDHAGMQMVLHAENIAKQLNKSYMKLSALPNVIHRYEKYGYIHHPNACMYKSGKPLRKVGNDTNGYRMSKCIVHPSSLPRTLPKSRTPHTPRSRSLKSRTPISTRSRSLKSRTPISTRSVTRRSFA